MTTSHNLNPEQPNASLAAETVLQNRYRIVRQLGRGGMGAVYEAVDERLEITVALKETFSTEDSMRRQFEREARLLAGMQHPALPRVSDHFVEGNRAFLVMEFIGGTDLARIIAQQPGPFPRDQVIAWADQLLDALIYLHSRDRQVIHRDIKPHNLKLTASGQIALLDFGLAKAQTNDPSVTASQAFFGYTRHYAPLEQIQDQRTDPRSDIYALGATLYHLLTGVKPPDAMVRAASVVNGGVDPLKLANELHAAVGPQIAAILSKALALKPEERYESATDFREALRCIGRARVVDVKVVRKVEAPVVANNPIETKPKRRLAAPDVNMALVGSARRFGPAGATAVLALVLTLAAGILYGAERLFPAEKLNVEKTPSDTAAAMRQSAGAHKTERAHNDNQIVTEEKSRPAEADRADRSGEKSEPAPAGEKKQPAAAKSTNLPTRSPELHLNNSRKGSRPVGAPSIRFPKPDFGDNAPTASPESRVRSYPSATTVSAARAPQFFRAANGTQIVKFSDGSTRLIYPGRHYGQATGAFR
ncbi:MAG TPA: serine/threonine-protein kinase [Pyrinomonadaceae bacterium]|nr:serine/threonine-protein kinase [Pyrinomonadaceae bacterium]